MKVTGTPDVKLSVTIQASLHHARPEEPAAPTAPAPAVQVATCEHYRLINPLAGPLPDLPEDFSDPDWV